MIGAATSSGAAAAAAHLQGSNDPRQRTVSLLKASIDQTHDLLSLLNRNVLAASAALLAAATSGSHHANPAHPPFMAMIELTMKALCSQQGAFTAACSIPSAAVSDADHGSCRQEADQLRIRLASALAQVDALRSQLGQPFHLPHSPPTIPEHRSATHIITRKRHLRPDPQSPSRPSTQSPVEDHHPEPAPKRQRLPAPPHTVPPPAKPHGFPSRLTTYSKNYASSRYTETGRLALTLPSTTVLAHVLVPTHYLPPAARQDYAAAIITSMNSSGELMNSVLRAVASSSTPRTIFDIHASNQMGEARPGEWAKYVLRWSVRPMVAVKLLDPNQPELAPVWRTMVDSLSPAEAQYVQGKDPRMVLMVGVDWVGYPLGMFEDSPAPDPQTTAVTLCERYGLVVGDLGQWTQATVAPQSTSAQPTLSFAPFPPPPPTRVNPPAHAASVSSPLALPRLASHLPARKFATNDSRLNAQSRSAASDGDNVDDDGWEVYVDGSYVRIDSDSDGAADVDDSGSDSESLTDIDLDGSPVRRPQRLQASQPNDSPTLVGTPSALLTFMCRRRRIGRYIHGRVRVHGRVTAVANELVEPRAWTPEMRDMYLAAVNADASDTLVSRVVAFAFNRGPMRPFSLAELANGVPVLGVPEGNPARKKLRRALSSCAVCPLHVVHRLPREGNGQVWDRLVSASGSADVPESAALAVVAGIELVGFETPSPGDVIPPCRARRFVVRERYAILV